MSQIGYNIISGGSAGYNATQYIPIGARSALIQCFGGGGSGNAGGGGGGAGYALARIQISSGDGPMPYYIGRGGSIASGRSSEATYCKIYRFGVSAAVEVCAALPGANGSSGLLGAGGAGGGYRTGDSGFYGGNGFRGVSFSGQFGLTIYQGGGGGGAARAVCPGTSASGTYGGSWGGGQAAIAPTSGSRTQFASSGMQPGGGGGGDVGFSLNITNAIDGGPGQIIFQFWDTTNYT